MGWFDRFKKKKPESERNYAVADMHVSKLRDPIYTNWSLGKAVKEGYKSSSWVYRCVYLISKAAASVPWGVYADGEQNQKHHLTSMLWKPNPFISRQQMFELITSWLYLAGNSYLIKVEAAGRTTELWPVSPDRMRPISAAQITEFIAGYALDDSKTVSFRPEQIIHHRFLNPENPLIGIAPLQVAGRAVDNDRSHMDFNTATNQSRGVIDGVFSFQRDFTNIDEADAITEKIREKYAARRGFLVLGSGGKYDRIALTPVEMDFMESRKFNREEICVIFGVPLPLVSQERTTYNNYQTAEEIFWTLTMLPFLDDLSSGFNFAMDKELGETEEIGYDVSNVPAIRRIASNRSETAERFYKMGVPFSEINRIFRFGVSEYPGWDKSSGESQRSSGEGQRKKKLLF